MGKVTSHTITLRSGSGSDTEVGDHLQRVGQPRNAKPGSRADLRDMARMGKRQEFSRNFGFLSIVGYSVVAMSTWQAQLATSLSGLTDGTGLSNLLWVYLVVFLLWCTVVASMAEMASMAPTSGGQYHWVSEFAPPRLSRILSYVTGWSCILAWHLNFISFCSNVSQDVQSLLILTGSDVKVQVWQLTLVIMGMATIAVLCNTNIRNSLPLIGGALILLYICSFLAVLVTLWVLGPRTDARMVFLSFSNRGDPRGIATSLIFGIFHPIFSLMAPDVAIHMAEEIKDSSLVLPRAIMTSTVLNGILGLVMLITFCYTIGDIKGVVASGITTHIDILFNATQSTAMTLFLTIVLDIIGVATCVCALTSASRQLFAFARDGGVPFASVLARIRPGWNVPLNAMLVPYGVCALITVINIGWNRPMSVVATVTVEANLFSYLVSITCVRLRRWRSDEPFPIRRWSLGRWGGLINDIAILFLAFLFILFFVPNQPHVDANNLSYNFVAWGGMFLLSIAYYFIKGKKQYTSPVTLIRKDY